MHPTGIQASRFSSAWVTEALASRDKRATWHHALNDHHGHRSVMHRITLQGKPFPATTA